jgi:hypothetical protein
VLKSGQSIDLVGNSVLEFKSGSLATIPAGASLSLDGSDTFVADAGQLGSNSALTANASTLSMGDGSDMTFVSMSNTGTISFFHQENIEITGNFNNAGTPNVDWGLRQAPATNAQ